MDARRALLNGISADVVFNMIVCQSETASDIVLSEIASLWGTVFWQTPAAGVRSSNHTRRLLRVNNIFIGDLSGRMGIRAENHARAAGKAQSWPCLKKVTNC